MKNTIQQRWTSLMLLLVFFPAFVFAQTITITGTVKDAKGESLPGVNVIETGTKNATITDLDGKFQIKAPAQSKLTFSYIGFQTKLVQVVGKTNLVVVLQDENKALNEVVVVGYGQMKRTDLTGSVVSVNSEAIGKSVATSLDQVLQGRAAGVQVQQNSGTPGGGSTIRIRGTNSLSISSDPIYVIDGVVIDGSTNSVSSNPLTSIDPSDIETMDVLKDASATAIYGSRGANGVIMITTKRGKLGIGKVTYSGYVGSQEMPKKMPMLNLQQYAYLKNLRTAAGIVQADNNFIRPDLLGAGTDWQDELFSKALMTSHNLTITGGTEKTSYAISGGYLNQEGIAVGSGFERYNLRANIDTHVKSWLKAGINVNLSNTNQTVTVTDESLIKVALKQTPNVAARNADGGFDGPETTEYVQNNPLGLALMKENKNEKLGVRGNTFLEATLLKGLTFKTELSYDYGIDNVYKFSPSYKFGAIENTVISSERSKSYNKFWAWRNILNFNRTFNSVHTVNIMLGQEAQKSSWEYLYGSRTGFISNVAHDLNMGDSQTATNQGSGDMNTLTSYFGRFFYSYNDRYLLTTTLRRDGSSKFAAGNRWGWFPSAALAWKISNEGFLKDSKTINNLKLRLGWGSVGNQNIPAYSYTSLLSSVPTASWGTGMLSSNTSNPELLWETTSSSNIGLDLGILKNRIELIADVYYKKTNNLLLQLPLPAYVGTSTSPGSPSAPWGNIGSLENKGIELTLNTTNINGKNFSWKTNLVFSLNRNKVLSMNNETAVLDRTIQEGSETNIVTRSAVGKPVSQFYGYKVIGRFEKATDFYYRDASGAIVPTAIPKGMTISESGVWIGDYIFEDINKDGVIDDKDRTYIGNPEPKFTFGIGNTVNIRNFDLTVFLSGSYGNKVVNYQRRWLENARENTNLLEKATKYAVLSKINPNGPVDYRNIYISGGDADMPRLSASSAASVSNYRYSDKFVEDGSFLRIQNISMGYNFPKRWISKVKIENLRVYANVQNLYTFTVYKGYDPEIGSISQGINGIDNARYPSPRIYTLGLNLTF